MAGWLDDAFGAKKRDQQFDSSKGTTVTELRHQVKDWFLNFTMGADDAGKAAEALIPRFKLDRLLNQGSRASTSSNRI